VIARRDRLLPDAPVQALIAGFPQHHSVRATMARAADSATMLPKGAVMATTTSIFIGTALTLGNLLLGVLIVLLAVRMSHARRDQPF
jgi:hypothetical protein